jgi:predicted transcriptional regulator
MVKDKPKKKMGRIPTGKVTIQLRMHPNTRDRLEHWARADGRPMSELNEEALLKYLKKREAKSD